MSPVLLIAGLIVACSSSNDDDRGCGSGVGERACSTDDDCKGFTGADLSLFGPSRSPLCVTARCEANRCQALPNNAVPDDDVRGDCERPHCTAEGTLEHVPDRTDIGKPTSECKTRRCEPGLLGGLGASEQNAPDGTSCSLPGRGLAGECRSGSCVEPTDSDVDASHGDAGDDAADGESDASDASTE